MWKGKKMAGRMGGERTTVQNCLVYKVTWLGSVKGEGRRQQRLRCWVSSEIMTLVLKAPHLRTGSASDLLAFLY